MKEQKAIGSVVAGLIAIGTILIGANQLVFTRSEGEQLRHQVERLEDNVKSGFDQMHQDFRTYFAQHRSKDTSMIRPAKKNAPNTGYAISDQDYQAIRARARKESGKEFFSFLNSFGDTAPLGYTNPKSQGGR